MFKKLYGRWCLVLFAVTFEQEFPEQAGECRIVGELVKVYDDIVCSCRDFKIVSAGNQH
ncbi:MAG: hypothetical protein JW837_08560 [Sedimentisphaerales bacterium]|nr:hypothetical protein [Sedimentisphaerales bacterium]